MKAYIITTNTDYTSICFANSAREAEAKANEHYKQEYDEDGREDWTAYDLEDFLREDCPREVFAVQSWDAFEAYLNI